MRTVGGVVSVEVEARAEVGEVRLRLHRRVGRQRLQQLPVAQVEVLLEGAHRPQV